MNATTTQHPDPIELIQLARGTLPPERAAELREHCLGCGPCGNQLAAVALLRQQGASRNRRKTRQWQVAAAVVLLVGVGLLVLATSLGTGSTESTTPGISQKDGVHDYAALASDVNLVHPTVVDTYARQYGEPVSGDSPERRFVRGLELLVQDRAAAAIEVFEEVRQARPNDPAVAGYLGIARYLDGDASPMTEQLLAEATARAQPSMGFYFGWYLANLHLRRGRVAAAETLLRDRFVLEMSPTARPAREMLDRIGELRTGDRGS